MTRDPRPYNGLHLPSGAQAVSQQQQLQAAFAQQHQAIARELYVRLAPDLIGTDAGSAEFHALAQQCQAASMAYFEGAGLVRPKQDESAE